MEVTGTVDMTILRGKVIFHKGKISGEKGEGSFVRPFLNKV